MVRLRRVRRDGGCASTSRVSAPYNPCCARLSHALIDAVVIHDGPSTARPLLRGRRLSSSPANGRRGVQSVSLAARAYSNRLSQQRRFTRTRPSAYHGDVRSRFGRPRTRRAARLSSTERPTVPDRGLLVVNGLGINGRHARILVTELGSRDIVLPLVPDQDAH